MPTIDDARATPFVIADGAAGQVRSAIAVQMFPPAALATPMFNAMRRKHGVEKVTAPVADWRPRMRHPWASVSIARNGRIVITGGGETIYDDSVDVIAPDEVDRLWSEVGRIAGHVILFVGGPEPLTTWGELDTASRAGHLVGALATMASSLPR